MIRILIVGDTRLYLAGIETVLQLEPDFQVVGTVTFDYDALLKIEQIRPDVVLLDRSMKSSIDLVRAIMRRAPGLKAILLSASATESEIVACAEAGVAGYVAKDAHVEELIAVIKAASRGELRCSPRVAGTLMRRIATLTTAAGRNFTTQSASSGRLTSREQKVLELLEAGRSNKEIASALGIEVATAKNHVHSILEKLGVSTRGEAAARARRVYLMPGPAMTAGSLEDSERVLDPG